MRTEQQKPFRRHHMFCAGFLTITAACTAHSGAHVPRHAPVDEPAAHALPSDPPKGPPRPDLLNFHADPVLFGAGQPQDAPATSPQNAATSLNTAPAEPLPTPPSTHDLFYDPKTGDFDVSGFLSSHTGFLPLAIPITEPAVGYGLTLGLSYFHSEPKVVQTDDDRTRVIMPSTTVVMGAGTENGTWAAGLGHLGIWDDGRIRYVGAVGYASLDLNWFGKGDALHGNSISYNNDVFFFTQNIKFKLDDSDFFLGPTYRFFSSDATLSASQVSSGIPAADLQSQTSGLGAELTYDSLDQPFSPTRGFRGNAKFSQQATWLGGDFNYSKIQTFAIDYVPLADNLVLGLKLNADFATSGAPFYDLAGIDVRGIERARYVDNTAIYGEAELRYDFTKRWTLVAFGGGGQTGSSFSDFASSDMHLAGGGGFRYLIAEHYGLRLGLDVAYGDGKGTFYVTVGTGWIRP